MNDDTKNYFETAKKATRKKRGWSKEDIENAAKRKIEEFSDVIHEENKSLNDDDTMKSDEENTDDKKDK